MRGMRTRSGQSVDSAVEFHVLWPSSPAHCVTMSSLEDRGPGRPGSSHGHSGWWQASCTCTAGPMRLDFLLVFSARGLGLEGGLVGRGGLERRETRRGGNGERTNEAGISACVTK